MLDNTLQASAIHRNIGKGKARLAKKKKNLMGVFYGMEYWLMG